MTIEALIEAVLHRVLDERLRPIAEGLARLKDAPARASLTADVDRYVGVPEAAAIAGVQPDTVRDWIKRGLRAHKPNGGARHSIHVRDLRAWIESSEDPDTLIAADDRTAIAATLSKLRMTE